MKILWFAVFALSLLAGLDAAMGADLNKSATVDGAGVVHFREIQPAPPKPLELGGVPDLIFAKLKESKAAGLITLAGKPGAAYYLPIWTWQTAGGTPIMEFPAFGYRGVMGQRPDFFATATLNLPGLSERWFGSSWFRAHVKKSAFPPVFLGPAALLPTDLRVIEKLRWSDWTKYAAVLLSVKV